MGMGMVISPPSLSAVQELKNLKDLIIMLSDKSISKELLDNLESKLSEIQKLVNEQRSLEMGFEKSKKESSEKEKSLQVLESSLKEKESEISKAFGELSKKNSEVSAKYKDLQSDLEIYAKSMSEFESLKIAHEKYFVASRSEILEKKEISEKLIKEYQDKLAKLKGLVGA